jgi:hypothetical protein
MIENLFVLCLGINPNVFLNVIDLLLLTVPSGLIIFIRNKFLGIFLGTIAFSSVYLLDFFCYCLQKESLLNLFKCNEEKLIILMMSPFMGIIYCFCIYITYKTFNFLYNILFKKEIRRNNRQ